MKQIYVVLMLIFSKQLYAQPTSLQWVKNLVSSSAYYDIPKIETDDNDNVYIVQSFSGSIDVDPGPGVTTLNSTGNYNLVIIKLNSMGQFVWAKMIACPNNIYVNDIAVDNSANLYVAGSFLGTADFDPGAGTNIKTSNGELDYYVLKLDLNGNLVWVKSGGGVNNDESTGIVINSTGDVLACGIINGTVDMDPGIAVYHLGSSSSQSIFVTKLLSNGSFGFSVLSSTMSETGQLGNNVTHPMDLDGNGNIIIAAQYAGTVDIDPSPTSSLITSTPGGELDSYVQKLDAGGNLVWYFSQGGTGYDGIYSVKCNKSTNEIYLMGDFNSNTDFNPGAGTNIETTTTDVFFIQKIDANKNYSWVGVFPIGSFLYSIDLDVTNNLLCNGYFSSTSDFDLTAGTYNVASTGDIDGIVLSYDPSKNLNFAYTLNNSGTDAVGYSVNTSSNKLVICGIFDGTPDFDPGAASFPLSNAMGGDPDVYIQTLNYNPTGSIFEADQDLEVRVFPNPAALNLNVALPIDDIETVSIVDLTGRIIYNHTTGNTLIDVSGLATGMYKVIVNGRYSTLFIKE